MSDNELMDKLKNDATFNPWIEKIDEYKNNFRTGIRSFVLDKNKVDDYENKVNEMDGENDRLHLRLDIPPQPFIGMPTAGIWLLLKNPGFSEIDLYDYWGTMSQNNSIIRQVQSERDLQDRRNLFLSQYNFSQQSGREFYLLDDSFNTCSVSGKGGFGWYSRYLFPKGGLLSMYCASKAERLAFCSRNIFVLDYHPYHSENYCEEYADVLKEDYWDKLVEHALTNNKLLVFWGSKILGKVKAQFGELYNNSVEAGRIYVLKGASAYFSSNCLFQVVGRGGGFLKPYLKV
jgi:hypothetical protein